MSEQQENGQQQPCEASDVGAERGAEVQRQAEPESVAPDHDPAGDGAAIDAAVIDDIKKVGVDTGSARDAAAEGDTPQAQLGQLQAELAEAQDQAMRAVADAQNARRRAEKDVTNARRYALEKFVQALLPVLDNLERAMDASQPDQGTDGGTDNAMLQGIELTLKSFLDVLKRFNVEPVDPLAEPFDPQLHEAISMVKNPEVEPNTVLTVVQKGYTLNGRLVRAAMVVVSSA